MLFEKSGVFRNPDRKLRGGRRGAVKNASQFLGACTVLRQEQEAKNSNQNQYAVTHHDRPRARSSGPLSRKSSGCPKNSFGTARRFAKSFITFSMPLSGT